MRLTSCPCGGARIRGRPLRGCVELISLRLAHYRARAGVQTGPSARARGMRVLCLALRKSLFLQAFRHLNRRRRLLRGARACPMVKRVPALPTARAGAWEASTREEAGAAG